MAVEMEVDTHGTRLLDLRPYDMRRTLGSWQANSGASLQMIGRTLGHKSQAATLVYAHLLMDPIRQSMETATSAILEAGGMKTSAEIEPIKGQAG